MTAKIGVVPAMDYDEKFANGMNKVQEPVSSTVPSKDCLSDMRETRITRRCSQQTRIF
jgi:hypothetical protein